MKFLKYAALLVVLCFASQAQAATCTWSGGTGNWDSVNTASWSCGHVPTTGDTAVFDGTSGGGTITVCGASSLTCPNGSGVVNGPSTITSSAFTGTLDFSAINPNVTLSVGLVDAATGVHTINLGNGTWTLTSTSGIPWNITAGANLTLNANSSTIAFAPATTQVNSLSFNGGNHSYNIVTAGGSNFNGQLWNVAGNNTIATFTPTGPLNFSISAASTQTFTNAQTWTGSAANAIIISSGGGTIGNLAFSTAGNIGSWITFGHVNGQTNTFTASSSLNAGGATGTFSISAPSGGGGGFIIGG